VIRLKICIVTPWFPSNVEGEKLRGIFLFRQLKNLKEIGYNSYVISIKRPGVPRQEKIEDISVFRVNAFMFPIIRYPFPNLYSLTKYIYKICRNNEIDILEYYNQDYLTALPIFWTEKLNLPIFVTINGLPGMSWKFGNFFVDNIGLLHTSFLGKYELEKADGIRLLANSLESDLKKLGIFNKEITTIHNGVDINIFKPNLKNNIREELSIPEENIIILYVGRLSRVKGIEYLIESFKRVNSKYKNLTLLIVGDGELRTVCKRMCRGYNNIIFTGTRTDINKVMSSADIFVLPSLSEGCPNAVLEASASGLSVIATKVGAVPELVENNKTGFVVTPKNVEELREKIQILIDDDELRKEMGRKARKYMEKNFSWKKTANKLDRFYKNVKQK